MSRKVNNKSDIFRVMFKVFKCEKPSSRQSWSELSQAEYVQPTFPSWESFHMYCHNGFVFKDLQPGSYVFMVNYSGFKDERKYMVRVVGNDLKLDMLI